MPRSDPFSRVRRHQRGMEAEAAVLGPRNAVGANGRPAVASLPLARSFQALVFAKGRTSYDGDGLDLASFRESSELEFGADDAFILVPDSDTAESGTVDVMLRHLKARHTEPKDVRLTFERACQRFTPAGTTGTSKRARPSGKLHSALRAAWAKTAPAADDAPQPFPEFEGFAE